MSSLKHVQTGPSGHMPPLLPPPLVLLLLLFPLTFQRQASPQCPLSAPSVPWKSERDRLLSASLISFFSPLISKLSFQLEGR